jgi:hypothetical protein
MSFPGSHGGLTEGDEMRRRRAAARIPDGYIHPNKAFSAGFILIIWGFFGAGILVGLFDIPLEFYIINAAVSFVVAWVLFYLGWGYDYLLFQQLDDVHTPSRVMGYAIVLTGPFAALIHWLARPSGY